ncbi:MAG: LysM peptidoglycan-binding domain-containing protein [Planctomycetota bacterium]
MTLAFRIFLLMLAAFAAVWVHRARSEDIARWLSPRAFSEPEAGPADPLASPLSGVPRADTDVAWLRLAAWPRAPVERPEAAESEAGEVGLEPAAGEDPEAADIVLESEIPGAEEIPGADEIPAPLEIPGGAGFPAGEAVSGEAPEAPRKTREPPAFEEVVYELRPGECLWEVAEKFLGSGPRFREICELNRDVLAGRDPGAIPAGTKLRIRRPAGSGR